MNYDVGRPHRFRQLSRLRQWNVDPMHAWLQTRRLPTDLRMYLPTCGEESSAERLP